MEVAGLAIGIVGLAGIIGTFRDVIDLFDMFAATKSLQREATLLMTKLDLEKFLLLRWAQDVRLVLEDYDERLNDPATQELVAHVLACIQRLMSDANELRTKYGIRDLKADGSNDVLTSSETSVVSASRLGTFQEAFANYQARLAEDGHSRRVGLRKRARWVIHDKDRFQSLVAELAYFIGKLGDILPPVEKQPEAKLVHRNLGLDGVSDEKTMRLIIFASQGHHHAIADEAYEAWEKLRRKKLLDVLWFRKLDERRDRIKIAHTSTLRWVLQPSKQNREADWDDLSEWLKSGSGLYWLCGKAGSGKSTLVRFISDTKTTGKLLSTWAQDKQCHIASYFFWNLGAQEQNTLQGLARSLLYQLLSQVQDVIPQALPLMWKEQEASDEDLDFSLSTLTLPSLAEMNRAFEIIGECLASKGEKACLLIDGLDEFVGSSCMEAISFVLDLAKMKSIKAVVSSRPVPECVAALGTLPKLQLQDLNRGDIRNYVTDVIGGQTYMQKLEKRSPEQAKGLVSDLVDKSSGVFLWVVLACRAVLAGFFDFDRIHELRARINELPPELEDMFRVMLNKVDPRHRQQTTRLLRTCFVRHQEAPRPDKQQKDRVGREMYTLSLALTGDYDLDPINVRELSIEERRELCESMEGRLRSRTAGLLELTKRSDKGGMAWAGADCFCGRLRGHDPFIDSKVDFIHRTVFEFLSQNDVWELDCLATPHKTFHPATSLSLGGLQLALQSITLAHFSQSQVTSHLYEGMAWGQIAEAEMPNSRDNIFWHVGPFFDALAQKSRGRRCVGTLRSLASSHRHGPPDQHSHAVLQFAIRGGAANYVRLQPDATQLARELAREGTRRCRCLQLFHYAGTVQVNTGGWTQRALVVPSIEMVSLLVSLGCDPNAWVGGRAGDGNAGDDNFDETTPWMAWLWNTCFSAALNPEHPDCIKVLRVTRKFIDAGASRNAPDVPELRRQLDHLVNCGLGDIESQATQLVEILDQE